MVSGSNTPYNPADNSAPFMVLPEHVDGFIDVQTLADIHRYLSESESEEDIALAAWIDANYLYEPMDKGGRKIRTTEGFGKLDRAYRRVRSLTNKAQDKWPFFDKNWKSMSTTTVRNNARGEAAPGVFLPGHGEAHDSPANNDLDLPRVSPAPQLQVPFGTKQPSRHQVKQQPLFPRPLQQTPVPLPSKKQTQSEDWLESEKRSTPQKQPESESGPDGEPELEKQAPQGLPKYTHFFSESESQVMPQSEPALESEPEKARASSGASSTKPFDSAGVHCVSELTAEPELEPVRDAGGGKVRGPNGRYLPKNKPSPASAKSRRTSGGARIKSVQKARSVEAKPSVSKQGEFKSPVSADDKDIFVDVQTPSPEDGVLIHNGSDADIVLARGSDAPAPTTAHTDEEPSDHAASEPTVVQFSAMTSSESTPSYLLAAEADAVPSNLDRLPPGFTSRASKRKSEPTAQLGQRKRGRPRKSQITESDQNADQGREEKEQPFPDETQTADVEETPRMATRRTTRRSAASGLVTDKPASTPSFSRRQEKSIEDKEKNAVDVYAISVNEKDTTAGHEVNAPTPSASKLIPLSPSKNAAPSTTEPRTTSATSISRNQSQVPDIDLLAIGLSKTSSSAQRQKAKRASMQTTVNGNANMANVSMPTVQSILGGQNGTSTSASTSSSNPAQTSAQASVHTPGRVEYFARVHTYAGTMDIPIATNKLDNDEVKLINKYAEWKSHKNGMEIPFTQFRELFGIMKD